MNKPPPKIIALSGSSRDKSWNKKLVAIAANGAKSAGAEVINIDLADFPMPVYNGDVEEQRGLPSTVQEIKSLMIKCDGFLIASPEYNGGYSALLKNTIDWISRPVAGEEHLRAFAGKKAVIMSTSPGAFGGVRGLAQLRQILTNIQMIVLPDQASIPNAHNAFKDDGALSEGSQHQRILDLGAKLTLFVQKFD
ncbi:MAG: NAD(P)H-dependent oxidoreductase [Pseudomonadota bacterium]|nr:NAD(P)H-dependent oxidoreductase [Pseudomonadota bacterium]